MPRPLHYFWAAFSPHSTCWCFYWSISAKRARMCPLSGTHWCVYISFKTKFENFQRENSANTHIHTQATLIFIVIDIYTSFLLCIEKNRPWVCLTLSTLKVSVTGPGNYAIKCNLLTVFWRLLSAVHRLSRPPATNIIKMGASLLL